jgi:hypothetical protein
MIVAVRSQVERRWHVRRRSSGGSAQVLAVEELGMEEDRRLDCMAWMLAA